MDNPPTPSRMVRFFSNPLVGVIGTAASVISIPLAIFFYFSAQQHRDLAAFVHPIRTSVVRMGQASKLSVKFEDRLIDSDVTAVQIAVWNRGVLAIRPANLLKPVTITMPGHRILEATIKKQTRDVVNFRLDPTKLADGRVPLNWEILEQGDGAVIQLIYAGDDTADINFEGVLEGQPSVSRLYYTRPIQQPEPQLDRYGLVVPLFIMSLGLLTGIGLVLSSIFYYIQTRSTHRHQNIIYIIYIISTVVGLVLCALSLIALYQLSTQCLGPPFGFQ